MMAVQALVAVTPIAAHSVLTPTPMKTGPRFRIWQSVVAFRTVSLSGIIVSTLAAGSSKVESNHGANNRQEAEASPGGPRETSCNIRIPRTVPCRASVTQGITP
jgi:hypothetical protein